MVEIPKLNNGCCGCTLRTSSLVLTWMGVIGGSFSLLIAAIWGPMLFAEIDKHVDTASNPRAEEAIIGAKLGFGVLITVLVVALIINLCALVGVHKRNYCLMMPFLIIGGVGCVLDILACVLAFFVIFVQPIVIVNFILYLGWTGLSIYFWLIVYSYYSEVKNHFLANENTFAKI